MFASGPWPDIKVQFWPAKGQKLEVLYSKKKKNWGDKIKSPSNNYNKYIS